MGSTVATNVKSKFEVCQKEREVFEFSFMLMQFQQLSEAKHHT